MFVLAMSKRSTPTLAKASIVRYASGKAVLLELTRAKNV